MAAFIAPHCYSRASRVLLASLLALTSSLACVSSNDSRAQLASSTASKCTTPPPLDTSVADTMEASFQGPWNQSVLSSLPALCMLSEIQGDDNPVTTFDVLRNQTQRRAPNWHALRAWRGRERELVMAAQAAGRYLPEDVANFNGSVVLMSGSVGAPRPPHLYVDITRAEFEAIPELVAPHVTHEAHHIGYLKYNEAPVLDVALPMPELIGRIWGRIHMEGLAVHAARGWFLFGALSGGEDATDYQVYRDPAVGVAHARRLGGWMRCLADRRVDRDVASQAVDAIAANERLLFRVGAYVANQIEKTEGPAALIETIKSPRRFRLAAERLVHDAGPGACPIGQVAASSPGGQ
jgi:hypothetical protein